MQRKTLICGATSAIAAEVAALCAARGDRLYLIGRDPGKLAALQQRCGEAVVGAVAADLNELGQAAPRVATAIAALGGCDRALIAHGYLGDQLRTERDVDYARLTIDTNFVSAAALLMPLAEHFEEQGDGHLAAITSVAGVRGRPRNYTYGASKAGLLHMTKRMALRLAPDNIAVSCIAPGAFASDMNKVARDHADAVSKAIPAGRIGTEEDMAGAAIYLASRAGDYVMGGAVTVDGGVSFAR